MLSPIEEAVHLHGHLGPNVVIGAKMALYAKKLLKSKEITACSYVSDNPPTGCMNDGMRAVCSDVEVIEKGIREANFNSGKKRMRISIRKDVSKELDDKIELLIQKHGFNSDSYLKEIEKLGRIYWKNYSDEELFKVQGTVIQSPDGTRL